MFSTQPFEQITSFDYLIKTTKPPKKADFYSHLKGDQIENRASISDTDYKRFLAIWDALGIREYYSLFETYAALDSSSGLDAAIFYFNFLFNICGIYPSYFLTSASFALQAALFNSKMPFNQRKPLKIQLLSEELVAIYNKAIIGGYSFVGANWAEFNDLNLKNSNENGPPDSHIRLCSYQDINGLYGSLLGSYHCFSNYFILSATENQEKFAIIAKHLETGDVDFFHEELLINKTIYFSEIELEYEKGSELLATNFDLSTFPFYEQVELSHLSSDQQTMAKNLNRDSGKEVPKLVSYLKHSNRVSDYAENICYSQAIHGAKITKVLRIVKCSGAPIFRTWINHIQNVRTKNPSNVLCKVLKSLCNSLTGKYTSLTL